MVWAVNEKVPLSGQAAVVEPNIVSPQLRSKLPSKEDKNIYYWEPKSLRIRAINWWHVFTGVYVYYAYYMSIFLLVMAIVWNVFKRTHDLTVLGQLTHDPLALQVVGVCVIIVAYILQMKPSVYCIDHEEFVPPESWQVSHEDLHNMMRAQGCYTEESLGFQTKLLERSGIGPSTHWPPATHPSRDGVTPAKFNAAAARGEAEAVVFPIVEQVLERTGVNVRQIDFLIVNCSLFTPTPSICAMVCNRFHFRKDVRSYNLGGMGCSANVVSVDLAKELLQNRPGTIALVISTENLTQNLYLGNEKSMLLQNTLFRAGGTALLLSSRRVDALRAKYKLLFTFRSQMSDDNSYQCVFEQEDEHGNSGVALSKDIVTVAGQAMRTNFVQLAPYVLPLREQARTVFNRCLIQLAALLKRHGWPDADPPKPYMPDFTQGIDHFCIHAGGRAVIEGVQKNLGLQERHVQPSKQTLYDWGNTSSSSIWYEAEWIERFGSLRRGDRILQIAFGSGFKCNSAVWVALRVDSTKVGVPLKRGRIAQDMDTADMADKAL